MKKVLVLLLIMLVTISSISFVIADENRATDSDEVKEDTSGSDVVEEDSEEESDEIKEDVSPALIREPNCIDMCLANDVSKDVCAKKCDIATHTLTKKVEVRPVLREAFVNRVDACLERCVESGMEKEDCRKKCTGAVVAKVRDNVADKKDACLERCVESGMEKDDCRKKCSPRMDEEHASDMGKARRAFAFNKEDFTKDELRKIAQLRKDQADDIWGEDAAEARKKLARLNVRKAEDLYKKRVVASDKEAAAKKRYEAARERHADLRGETDDRGNAFKDVKARLKECGDDCAEAQADALARGKEYVAKAGERVLSQLEKVRSKIESNEHIDAERADEIIAKLDAATAKVKLALGDSEAATTKEELKSAAKTIAGVWKRVNHVVEEGVARVVTGEVGEIVVRSRQLEVKLEKLLVSIEERGIEVANLDALTDKFGIHIAEARELHEHAVSLLEDVALTRSQKKVLTPEEREQLTETIKKSKGLLKDAQEKLKEAHGMMVEIAKDIHKSDDDASFEGAEDEDLVEDESEDDSDEEESEDDLDEDEGDEE
ncbi:MAG: hypothetical protein O2779_03365 [Nanoarchaeota archaeon]|nr:hypothetical protein [Nanoarchaeota archaeon]